MPDMQLQFYPETKSLTLLFRLLLGWEPPWRTIDFRQALSHSVLLVKCKKRRTRRSCEALHMRDIIQKFGCISFF